jgi:hypothetical protein
MRFKLIQNHKWYDWFAWYPVIVEIDNENRSIGRTRIWLETVERQRYQSYGSWYHRAKSAPAKDITIHRS